MKIKRLQDKTIYSIAITAVAIFCLYAVYHSFYVDLGFDPAYHATVAKNFASGYGYATSYNHKFIINPDITTGPVMLLFASLVMLFLGNALWVPAFSAAFLNSVLLCGIIYRFKSYFDSSLRYLFFVLALLVLFFLYDYHWWTSLKGDFTAILFALLALLFLYDKNIDSEKFKVCAACILVTLAVYTKSTVLFSLIGFVPFVFLLIRKTSFRYAVKLFSLGFLLAVITVSPWKVYEAVMVSQLSQDEKQEREDYATQFFVEQGSGISELMNSDSFVSLIAENIRRNSDHLYTFFQSRYDFSLSVIIIIAVVTVGVMLFSVYGKKREENSFSVALYFIVILHLAWFFMFSASWNAKYALTATVLFFVISLFQVSKYLPLGFGLLAVVLIFQPSSNVHWPQLKKTLTFQHVDSQYKNDLLAVSQYLEGESQRDHPLAGCGFVFAPHAVEYSLSGEEYFRDCRGLVKEGVVFDEGSYIDRYPNVRKAIAEGVYGSAEEHYFSVGQYELYQFNYLWDKPVNFYLVASHIYWQNSSYKYRYQKIFDACVNDVRFKSEYFSVSFCSYENLKKYVPLNQRLFFLKHQNNYHFVHKPQSLGL